MATKKSNSVITTSIEGTCLVFNVLGAGTLRLDVREMSTENQDRALMHGMKQRISDAAAIPRNTETGQAATAAEKFDAMQALVQHYMSGSGEWSPARSAGGGERDSGGITLQAIARVKGVDMAAARAMVERAAQKAGKETKAILAELAKSERVALAILDIKREGIKSALNSDDLLDEI